MAKDKKEKKKEAEEPEDYVKPCILKARKEAEEKAKAK